MPDPKDYMDDKHSYVRGYVRRKHIESDLYSKDSGYIDRYGTLLLIFRIVSWIVHLFLIVASFVVPFKVELQGDWGFFCIGVGICLLTLLFARIKYWWQNL